ncbi:Glycoside hydrolase family 31 protein [Mycena venus]|uniref:Glycoside hydrolase family 31 protein n=1 Tax=Mycena venus TaxID=2733690 RepID=A0A8H6X3E8_9AGAR|nr:Glycoside hydrolase family 31 protein [Mycena venus]
MFSSPVAAVLWLTLVSVALADEPLVNSFNVSTCPGYSLHSLSETDAGLTAQLSLAGPACNAFGIDITDLTIEVKYETETRLHVNIFDTANSQFTIPETVVTRAQVSDSNTAAKSDLVFNYDPSPFAFWITRRSAPHSIPLFDTRPSSLPTTPIPPVIAGDPSTELDGFPLVFENQYIQVTILGVVHKPSEVLVGGEGKTYSYAGPQQKLVVSKLALDLNGRTTIEWK